MNKLRRKSNNNERKIKGKERKGREGGRERK
jgi:hypothetical protein